MAAFKLSACHLNHALHLHLQFRTQKISFSSNLGLKNQSHIHFANDIQMTFNSFFEYLSLKIKQLEELSALMTPRFRCRITGTGNSWENPFNDTKCFFFSNRNFRKNFLSPAMTLTSYGILIRFGTNSFRLFFRTIIA